MFDGAGLHLLVTPAGRKLRRLAYRISGRERLLALGSWPTVSLADARRVADDAKRLLATGADPSLAKRAARAQVKGVPTFAAVAEELIAEATAEGRADATIKKAALGPVAGGL